MDKYDDYSEGAYALLPYVSQRCGSTKIGSFNDDYEEVKPKKEWRPTCPPLRFPKLAPARSDDEYFRTRTPLQISVDLYGEEEVEGKPTDPQREWLMLNYEIAIERKIYDDEMAARIARDKGEPEPEQPYAYLRPVLFRSPEEEGPNWNLCYRELDRDYQKERAAGLVQDKHVPQPKPKPPKTPETIYSKTDPILTKHAQSLKKAMENNRRGEYRDNIHDYVHMRMESDQNARENYDLKVRMIHLEARLEKTKPYYIHDTVQENKALKLRIAELKGELKRQKIASFHHEEYIKKISRTEKARKVCFNPIKGTTEEEQEMHFHLQESNKCHSEFKHLMQRLKVQEEEKKLLEKLLNNFRTHGSANEEALANRNKVLVAEIKELKQFKVEAEALKAENQRLIAENAEMNAQLQEQSFRNDQQGSSQVSEEKEGLLHTVAQLQDDVHNLSGTNELLSTDIAMYQQEIQSLKDQLSQAIESPLASSCPDPQTEYLQLKIQTLRDQLEAADRPKAPAMFTKDCSLCKERHKQAVLDHNIPLSILAKHVVGPLLNPKGEVLIANMLYLENHFYLLIDKLKYSMTIEDATSRNELIKKEIAVLESICQKGNFPKVSQVMDLDKERQVVAKDLVAMKDQIRELESDMKISTDSIDSRNCLLREILDGLSRLVPISVKWNPSVDFEQFKTVINEALLAASHLFNDKVKLDIHQANEELKASVSDLEKRLEAKSKELDIATKDQEINFSRYTDLKEKAMILKNRLAQAKILNDETKKKLHRLESGKSNSGSYSPGSTLDSVSVDE